MTEECLSIMELLELRASGGAELPGAERHIRECPRCVALLRTLPDVQVEETLADVSHLRAHPLTGAEGMEDIRAGQIWRARAPDHPDRRYVVVVTGRRRGAQDGVVVVPTSTELDKATNLDLVVDDSALGYTFLVSVWHFGTVFRDQLEECLGNLGEEQVTNLKTLYQHIVMGEGRPITALTGSPAAGEGDERLIWRAEQLERLRPLWRPWRKAMAEQEREQEREQALLHGESEERKATLSALLQRSLEAGGWDVISLAEAAHVSRSQTEALLADHLDLTDQTDADQVAAIVRALGLDFVDVEAPLRRTLESSSGGLRVGVAGTDRIAARTLANVSEERRSKEVYEGLATVDESEKARRGAIESYLQAISAKLDELNQS